jgi:hypothetical protein
VAINATVDRFWKHVHKTGDCWLWTGATRSGGYGVFRDGTRSVSAHRFAWELEHGLIPSEPGSDGKASVPWLVSHACGNRRCVRPDHLSLTPPAVPGSPHNEEVSLALPAGHVPAEQPRFEEAARPAPYHITPLVPLADSLHTLRSEIERSREQSERLSASLADLLICLGSLHKKRDLFAHDLSKARAEEAVT